MSVEIQLQAADPKAGRMPNENLSPFLMVQINTAMCVHANLAPSNSYCMKSLPFHTQTRHLLRTPTLASTTNP
jgi:hypothetical protein